MISVFRKEISSFFGSVIGILVISVFVVIMGLFLWVFRDTSILVYKYAGLDQLFNIAPFIFMFLIPAITMRVFSEEMQSGTIEWLSTKPLTEWNIVMGKFFACFTLVLIALLPTLIYLWSIYRLASPVGNIDFGAIAGSYIGLVCLSAAFVAIGCWASTLSKNQIVSFILGTLCCFLFYSAFLYISKLPIFFGKLDLVIEGIGIDQHYRSMSRGLIDSRDLIYFFSLIGFFLFLCKEMLHLRKARAI